MRILRLIASIDPACGGPSENALVIATEHARAGHETVFVTLDDPGSPWAQTFPFELHATGPTRGPGKSSPRFAQAVARLAPGCDGAVIDGLWNHASIGGYRELREAGLPWVIFPHGMLDPYFRRAKPLKHLIKQVYWLLWQGRMLSRAAAVLFTCAEESRLAQGAFFGYQAYRRHVVNYCAGDQRLAAEDLALGRQEFARHVPGLDERPYWLFLSRIHPKKAIDTLIAAYGTLVRRPDCPDLVIAGPDSAGWQATLERQVQDLGLSGRVHFPGMLLGGAKAAAFAQAEAFVLPSHQENFGLVVAEALSVSTPVLLSDKVNIWREVVEAGAGLAEPDTIEGTERLLRRFLDLPVEARHSLRSSARPCYEKHFSAKAAADDLLDVLFHARKA